MLLYTCLSQTEDSAHGHSAAKSLVYASSLGDSIMLIVALCFHSVFEGIAIGVAGKLYL